jgi:hypothetical protein
MAEMVEELFSPVKILPFVIFFAEDISTTKVTLMEKMFVVRRVCSGSH